MGPSLGARYVLSSLTGVSFDNPGIENPQFVLIDFCGADLRDILRFARGMGIPQLNEYSHEQFHYLHKSISRAGVGPIDNTKIWVWLVMDLETCMLFKLKYTNIIVGIVTLPNKI